jgi:hypothetical protein
MEARGHAMHLKSCNSCLEWTASNETVEDAIKGRWQARQVCAHQPIMRVAIEQFRKGHPAWWVVGGSVVVPIWTVELMKKRGRVLAMPAAA